MLAVDPVVGSWVAGEAVFTGMLSWLGGSALLAGNSGLCLPVPSWAQPQPLGPRCCFLGKM